MAKAFSPDVMVTMSVAQLSNSEVPIEAGFDLKPDTLNIRSKGKYVTGYIEFPMEFDPNDIKLNTVQIYGSVFAEQSKFEIGDYDCDGVQDITVKFDRAELIELLPNQNIDEHPVTVTGVLSNRLFSAFDMIRIINPSEKE
jgi:hypothetical protein